MSKYDLLWKYLITQTESKISLTFPQIEQLAGLPIDHSFLKYKNELADYGWKVAKISLKNSIVSFEKLNSRSIYLCEDPKLASPLFDGWNETLIWSCLEGIMGRVYADRKTKPMSAAAHLGDFCFLAGKADERLVEYDYGKDFLIMVPQNDEWSGVIEKVWGNMAVRTQRYAIKKEPDCFQRDTLRKYINSLPCNFRLQRIDRRLYEKCLESDWSRDLVSQFSEYGEYERLGLGFVITENGAIVSGASSYSRYSAGIEIEVDTKEEYRRRGLASAAAATLITDCLDRKIYPSWDAQNPWSVGLAEKLGYTFDYVYPAYEIRKNRETEK